ncbi:Uncharacterized protein BP5553_02532 [Venustampulla echinocandica]|uniref:Uncharacterized protein n=1 Tax=Venustampulla echinocandica TaxID=2656787 RepID=A0A370U482_9HELO|nr:Uncharacterized protein BP5553_02532 [Venustampulla echinocandica]RDL42553.1 Uncharacterized protein BP5553_02532 [Venustampulla echinocandica]
MAFHHANFPPSASLPSPDTEGRLTLHVPAPTDVWRKPPSHDVFGAPIVYQSMKVSEFKSARVSASGEWKTLYDQGGLIIVLPAKKSSASSDRLQKRWIKMGIEFYDERPMMSVVAADAWADWSLCPLEGEDEKAGKMTVAVERKRAKDGGWGPVLQVLRVGKEGVKTPIREVTWAFHDIDEDAEMWVGMFGAKPTESDVEELVVRLEGFEVEMRS